jgi:hypothetical protein
MPPKRRAGTFLTRPQDVLSITERQALLAPAAPASSSSSSSTRPSPYPPGPALPAPSGFGAVAAPCVPPARRDVGAVRNLRRGGIGLAEASLHTSGLDVLVRDLRRDRDSASGRGVGVSLLGTWHRFHSLAFPCGSAPPVPVLPLTALSIELIGAIFKAGDYRSFPNYLSVAKTAHIEAGHLWGELLSHTGRWVTRSVLRGIGPARQSQPWAMATLLSLARPSSPLVVGGPRHPVESALLASMFLLREVEMAASQVRHLLLDDRLLTVTWTLTASKTDPCAHGTTRSWGCLCGVAGLPCPYHLARHLVDSALSFASTLLLTDGEALLMPLFHNDAGSAPTKALMVESFEAIATLCGLPLCSPDGLRLFGGHTARVTGAQALAACGVEVDKIRIMARHSGDAILRYVALAPLTSLRSDLGLPSSSASSGSTSPACHRRLSTQLAEALRRLDVQEASTAALTTLATSSRICLAFVRNTATGAIHGLRPGDSTHTVCGWYVHGQRRGGLHWLSTVAGEPWANLCERCLLPERQSARLLAGELEA